MTRNSHAGSDRRWTPRAGVEGCQERSCERDSHPSQCRPQSVLLHAARIVFKWQVQQQLANTWWILKWPRRENRERSFFSTRPSSHSLLPRSSIGSPRPRAEHSRDVCAITFPVPGTSLPTHAVCCLFCVPGLGISLWETHCHCVWNE